MNVSSLRRKNLDDEKLSKPSLITNFPISGAIAVYVDDLIVCGDKITTDEFYTEFEKSCTISKPEELKEGCKPITFLGFQYTRGKDYVKIDPSDYTKKNTISLRLYGCKTKIGSRFSMRIHN